MMPSGRRLDEITKEKIKVLSSQGVDQAAIAERFGIAQSRVSQILAEDKGN